jgi:triacylglycerol lipase
MKTMLAAVALSLLTLVGCSAPTDGADTGTTDDALSAASPLGADPHGAATRYPIVLAHGFMGSRDAIASFNSQIVDGLTADGHKVYRAEVPPFGSVAERAKVLATEVDKVLAETGAPKVNLVAHSMGGLDARELISVLGYGDRIASLTTVATPHRGSQIADLSLGLLQGANDEALDAIAKAIGKTYSEVADDVALKQALRDLSEANADAFNAAHPDDARVYYQSWAGVSSILAIPNPADADACEGKLLSHPGRADLVNPILAPAMPFVSDGGQSNDGFVRVSSAKWGNFRGCVPADHADEIGVMATKSLDPHTGFDFVRFHRDIAFDLANQGF